VEPGFEFAPIGLTVTRRRIIERCNARFCEMFGYGREALIGQSLALLYPSRDEFERIGEIGTGVMKGTGRYEDERIMRRKSGGLFWCRVRGQTLTPDDPLDHSVWSMADLSESRPIVQLTRRERQIAMLLTEGKTAKEIARDLGISHRTAEAHRARLIAKFEARNTPELVARLAGMPF
jgi:PAS domain S-box-containing protein